MICAIENVNRNIPGYIEHSNVTSNITFARKTLFSDDVSQGRQRSLQMGKKIQFRYNEMVLATPTQTAAKILNAAVRDKTSLHELTQVLTGDPDLTGRVLKLVNTGLITGTDGINTIDEAIEILGSGLVTDLALALAVTSDLHEPGDTDFGFTFFWQRAFTAATTAGMLARKNGLHQPALFVAALLQDIGVLIFFLARPRAYSKILKQAACGAQPVQALEDMIFHTDHQQLGADQLKEWGFSRNIYVPIRYHHATGQAPANIRKTAGLLILADRIASFYHGARIAGEFNDIKRALTLRYHLAVEEVQPFIASAGKLAAEIFEDVTPVPGQKKTACRSNAEQRGLNISYAYAVRAQNQSVSRAELLAEALLSTNRKE